MDEIPNGDNMHNALKKYSKYYTVPNIYIGGVHIGGASELNAGIQNGKVKMALDNAGVSYQGIGGASSNSAKPMRPKRASQPDARVMQDPRMMQQNNTID